MDNDQITALAREYAEEMIKGKPSEELPNCLKNSMLAMNTEYIAEIFQWLTRRYCLVEKDAVRKAFSQLFDKFLTDNDAKSFGAASVVLESLFPEIAKEVEE